jgi:APA family basic amino acid/polyamine antiporter
MVSPSRSTGGRLVRQLGLTSATALVVANMIGTGIFSSSGFLAGDLGDPKLLLLIWVVGAVCALSGSFCYSELGVNYPGSGGEYVYLSQAYGPTWGFMTGWVSFFAGFSAPIAAAALAFSGYLSFFFPSVKQSNAMVVLGSGDFSLQVGGAQLLASGLIALFTIINCMNLRLVARIQNVLTGTKLVVLLAFIVFGFVAGTGSWSHFSMTTQRTSSTPIVQQFAISLFWIYVSYSGWNAATYIAEEVKQPARTLPLALSIGTGLVALLYVGLNIVFIYAAPLQDMKGVLAVGSLTAFRLFGQQIAGIFSALMALCLVSTVNAMVTIGPRLYYAMAKNGAFFATAAKVDPKRHTPTIAILCQGLCAMAMTVTPFPQLVFYIGFLLNFFTAMSVASLFIFRRRPEWQKLRVVSFAFPLVPAVFLLVASWMTLYGLTLQPVVAMVAVFTVVAGALLYRLHLRPVPIRAL